MDAQTQPVDSDVTAVFLANQPSLERYARSLTRDQDEAADVCQEVFIRLLVIARDGRMPDVPGAWMHRVAHNIVVSSARRKSTRERTLERLSEGDHLPSTEDAVIGRERDEFVRQALTGVRPGRARGDGSRRPGLSRRRDRRPAGSHRTGDPNASVPLARPPPDADARLRPGVNPRGRSGPVVPDPEDVDAHRPASSLRFGPARGPTSDAARLMVPNSRPRPPVGPASGPWSGGKAQLGIGWQSRSLVGPAGGPEAGARSVRR